MTGAFNLIVGTLSISDSGAMNVPAGQSVSVTSALIMSGSKSNSSIIRSKNRFHQVYN